MPEFASAPRTTRKQVDPRDSFSWTTPNLKVSAQATDPFVTAGNIQKQLDPNLLAFVDTMKNISELTNGYINVQKSYGKENQQKAITDARSGKPPATEHEGIFNGGYGYNEAYNVTVGESKGLEFSKAYLAGIANNGYFQTQTDPNAAHKKYFDDLYQQHFQAVGDNPQILFGASEQLKRAQVEGNTAMQQANFKTSKDTFMNSMNSLQQDHLFTYARGNKTPEDLAQLRRILNDDWEFKAKPTNLMTRDEYTKVIIQNVSNAAVQLASDPKSGTHDALDKAYKLLELYDQVDPDNKMSWATMVDGTGQLKFRSEIDDARTLVHKIQQKREAEDIKELKRMQDETMTSLYVDTLLNPDMPLSEKVSKIKAARTVLTEEQLEKLVDKATAYHKDEQGYDDNHQTVIELRYNIETAESVKALEVQRKRVMDEYKVHLKSKTASEFLSRITSRIDHLKSEGRANTQLSLDEKKLGWDTIVRVFGAPITGDIDGTQVALRLNTYSRMFWGRVRDGQKPSQVAEELVEHYSKMIKRTQRDTFGASPYKTKEEIREAVLSGKLKPDEGKLELQRLSGVQ